MLSGRELTELLVLAELKLIRRSAATSFQIRSVQLIQRLSRQKFGKACFHQQTTVLLKHARSLCTADPRNVMTNARVLVIVGNHLK